uniref:Retrotransposon gag domain-containing protein n=1 Tax=Nicotiana tabacum TaxID=4097 RepID=A0A1S3ZQJ7_TOBAC|nr:PREDICTED: uncharacterized protein LOC107789354 [Nicotiana tabacum]
MALFEDIYARKCRSPVGWFEHGETQLLCPDKVQNVLEKVALIRKCLRTEVDKNPLQIRALALPPRLFVVHHVFHVSILRRYVRDHSHKIQPKDVKLDENLTYEEGLIVILDRQVRQLRSKKIPSQGIELVADEFIRVDLIVEVRSYQNRAQTSRQVTFQPEVLNAGQPQATMPDRVQELVVHDAPPLVLAVVPTVTLPADVVLKLLNVLEALVPTEDGLPAPQSTSHVQAQVLLNVAAPQMAPQQIVQPVANTGQSKDLKNFMDLKPPELDVTQASIGAQKFIQHCENILTTLALKETRWGEFTTFLFLGFAESWWNSDQRGRQAGLPPITWSEFSIMFMDRFLPLSKRENMRRHFEKLR